jgi:hypothetical protein
VPSSGEYVKTPSRSKRTSSMNSSNPLERGLVLAGKSDEYGLCGP